MVFCPILIDTYSSWSKNMVTKVKRMDSCLASNREENDSDGIEQMNGLIDKINFNGSTTKNLFGQHVLRISFLVVVVQWGQGGEVKLCDTNQMRDCVLCDVHATQIDHLDCVLICCISEK